MKPEIRVLGIDDGCFEKFKTEKVLVVGAVMRGALELDGVLSCYITRDGSDSTEKLIELMKKSKHFGQLKAIMLNGSTLAGFNLVDINKLSTETNLPVICVLRKAPNFEKVEKALEHFPEKKKKLELIRKAGNVYKYKKLFFQCAGGSLHNAFQIIDKTLRKSSIPEPIRIAHLIASGVTAGESTKRV
jgi:endonuclease V-like protein UPF0215 family